MNPRHRRDDDDVLGGSAAHQGTADGATDSPREATGVAAQAALGDGIVGGIDGRDGLGSHGRNEASESDAEPVASDEEVGLAAGESD